MTDFDQRTNCADYIKDDPFRRGLHFAAIEEALGDVAGNRILDIGCGDGLFPRLLAQRGASVLGYDRAPQRIAEARAPAGASGVDATFVVATPDTFVEASTLRHRSWCCSLRNRPKSWRRSSAPHRATLRPADASFRSSSIRWARLRGPALDQARGQRCESEFLDRASGRIEMTVVEMRQSRVKSSSRRRSAAA